MSNSVVLKFDNCVVSSATSTVHSENDSIRFSVIAGLKITYETPIRYTSTVDYGEFENGVAHKINETFDPNGEEISFVQGVYVNYDGNTNKKKTMYFPALTVDTTLPPDYRRTVFPTLFTEYWPFDWAYDTGTPRWEPFPEGHYERRMNPRGQYRCDYDLDRTEPSFISSTEVYSRSKKKLLISNSATLFFTDVDLGVDGNTVVVTPQCFGTWETTEDVILTAIAPEELYEDTAIPPHVPARPDSPTLTFGRARFKVEPYYPEEEET